MQEIELKFQVPAAARQAVDAAVAGRAPARRQRLQAVYVDTGDAALAAAGLALRLRREGRRWVQTLKGTGRDGMTRLEHNVPVDGLAAQAPLPDPARHAGTPAGERLAAVLGGRAAEALQGRFRTDILRRTRVLRGPGGVVELAFDEGWIVAGESRLAVCELEIELKRGEPRVVIEIARRWALRHGLWLDIRSKAERGDLLACGEAMAAPRGAQAVTLQRDMTADAAYREVLRQCADQVLANASQVADGRHAAEHVHQLRVGLRRLRSAVRFFDGLVPGPPSTALADSAAALFRALGGSRDLDVMRASFGDDLRQALRAAGVDGEAPLSQAAVETAPAGLLRAAEAQRLCLDLLAAGLPVAAPTGEAEPATPVPLRTLLARRLSRWHRRAADDASRFAELDDLQRHRLRKRVKRLRYAVEFGASLFDTKRVRRYLKPLRDLQDRLGELNDVAMALDAFRALRDSDPRAWFALGWLAARRVELLAAAGPELKAFAKAPRFWKRA